MSATGFVSYSHVDWEACQQSIDMLIRQLEKQTHAAWGKKFTIWRDIDGVRWGDDWLRRIESELQRVNILFIFLSPCWLESDVCQKEYRTFIKMNRNRKSVYVVSIRELLPEHQKAHAAILEDLNTTQIKRWDTLMNGSERDLKNACLLAASDVAKDLSEWCHTQDPSLLRTSQKIARKNKIEELPSVHDQPLVSGGFYMPRVDQGGETDGKQEVRAQVVFLGPCTVNTRKGTFVVFLRAAEFYFKAEGGIICEQSISNNERCSFNSMAFYSHMRSFNLNSASTAGLQGNVLSSNPLEDYVPIFKIDRDPAVSLVRVSGEIRIHPECIEIDIETSRPKSKRAIKSSSVAWDDMRRKIAAIVIGEQAEIIPLEEASR